MIHADYTSIHFRFSSLPLIVASLVLIWKSPLLTRCLADRWSNELFYSQWPRKSRPRRWLTACLSVINVSIGGALVLILYRFCLHFVISLPLWEYFWLDEMESCVVPQCLSCKIHWKLETDKVCILRRLFIGKR